MQSVLKTLRCSVAVSLVVCALAATTPASAQERETPHHRGLKSFIEEIVAWALDQFSLPPG